MQPTIDDIAGAAAAAACEELSKALKQIKHCVDQLTDEQVWKRPTEAMNSIGNLLLHLTGNVRQYLVAGIGGAKDIRERPREFSERGPIAKKDLLARLEMVVAEAQEAIQKTPAAELLRARPVQTNIVNGFQAMFASIPHFRGHTQEIIHMTRTLLGEAYKYAGPPAAPVAKV
jgi:uncharacterized damage-inducible protein DinB